MRIASFIFLWVSCFTAKAQEKTVQHIGWKGNRIELHTINNKQQSCTVLLGKDSLKVFLINDNAKVIELFTIQRIPNENFSGGFIKNSNIYLYLDNPKKDNLHSLLYNIDSKILSENLVPFVLKSGKIINKLSSNNYFFYFTLNTKTSEFVIYRFNDEMHYDTTRYTSAPGIVEDMKNKDGSIFNKATINVERADMEGECDLDIARDSKKLYVRNDTLFLLINNLRTTTKVYTFDLTNNKMDYRLIMHKNDDSLSEPFVCNSFLLRNNLYYASASYNNLFLQVLDFYTGNIIKEFKANRNEEINFKNTPITQEGDAMGGAGVRELGKTKQLLRKMTNGSIVITAILNDEKNVLELLVGSYQQITSGGGGGGMWMGGGGMSAPIFMPSGGFSHGSWSKSARFKMLISASNYEHLNGDIPLSINDRIDNYTKGIKIPAEGENLFVINGNYNYAYYDKDKLDFILVKL